MKKSFFPSREQPPLAVRYKQEWDKTRAERVREKSLKLPGVAGVAQRRAVMYTQLHVPAEAGLLNAVCAALFPCSLILGWG